MATSSASFGDTFSKAAWDNNVAEVERMLTLPGADINAISSRGQSALYCACRQGATEVVRVLIKYDQLNVNIQVSAHGGTPLHAAGFYSHAEIVAMLLAKGADTTIKNNTGLTAHQDMKGTAIEVYKIFSEDKGLLKLAKQYPSVKEICDKTKKPGTIRKGRKMQKGTATFSPSGAPISEAEEEKQRKGVPTKVIDHPLSPYFSAISPDWQPPIHLMKSCFSSIPLLQVPFEPNFSDSEFYGGAYDASIYLSPFDSPIVPNFNPSECQRLAEAAGVRRGWMEPVISASAFAQSERPCDWCWIFHGINSVPFLGLSDSKFTYVDFTSWNEHLISLADEQSIFVPAKKNASIQLPHDEFQQFIDAASSLFHEAAFTPSLPANTFTQKTHSPTYQEYLQSAAEMDLKDYVNPRLEVLSETFRLPGKITQKQDDSSQSESTTSTTASASAGAASKVGRRRQHKLIVPKKDASMSSDTV